MDIPVGASVELKKKALREKLASKANNNNSLTPSQRTLLDNAIEIKKKASTSSSSGVYGFSTMSKEEKKVVKSAEKAIGKQITIKDGRAKFVTPTTASNFAVRSNDTREKQQALNEHLKKVEARKTDYKIVKGEYTVESNTSIRKVTSLDVSDSAIQARQVNPVSVKDTNIIKNTNSHVPSGGSGGVKTSLKHCTKDFEKLAKQSFQKSDDTGSQAVGMTYEMAKATLVASAKLTAINQNIPKATVKVVKGGVGVGETAVKVGKGVYKIGKDINFGIMTGTLNGTLNIYKNMAFSKVCTAVKYSKPVYVAMNIGQGAKTIAWSARYKISKSVTFVKGFNNGLIKVTAKEAGRFAGKTAVGAGKLVYKSGKRVYTLANAKIVRGSLRGATNAIKKIGSKSDDVGMQAVGLSLDSAKYSVKALKMTGKVSASVAKGAYRTGRGTYRFAKDIKKIGFKGASKIWYNAHLRGAGKKISEKFFNALQNFVKKALFNPVILGAIALVICTVVISNTAVVSATSVVGGVIDFFEELGEGLAEVWDTVTSAVADFFSTCADWLVSLFSGESEPEFPIDVDVGDGMSICEYLLGAVQLYKAEYALDVGKRRDDLLEDEGYHGVMLYNLAGSEMEVHDIRDPDKGLMTDKAYVKAILPVWKAIILGTIGTDFTGRQANDVSKECFDIITEMEEIPYVDLDFDGVADYSYCNGTSSLHEGENKVYTHIGGVLQEGIHSDTGWCYNNTGVLYHDSHNTEGLACCHTTYWCGGHSRYKCNGHLNVTYCDGGDGCSNRVTTTTYCGGGASCTNVNVVVAGGATHYICKGHSSYSCGGHESTTYCWWGWRSSCEGCSDYLTENYQCYYGTGTTPHISCTNEQSHFECRGYQMCKGHKIMKFRLGSYGFSTLLQEKFLNRIAELEAIPAETRTSEQIQELSQLRMYYEYCIGCDAYGDPIADEFFAGLGDDGDVSPYTGSPSLDFSDVTLTDVTAYATSFIGLPYVWGGNSLETGCDCSGFVREVYRHFGIEIAERTSYNMCNDTSFGTVVTISNIKAGDLVFYYDRETSRVSHVAMYIGNNKIVHERGKKWGCRVDNLNYWNAIYCIKRVIP